MIKKKNRLNTEAFNRFFSLGRRFHSPLLTLIYSADAGFYTSAVLPKKFAHIAVLRNKFRRRVYDVLRRQREEHQITGVYIVIGKVGATKATYDLLRADLLRLLHTVSQSERSSSGK
jgi:ribonuclease P protein component